MAKYDFGGWASKYNVPCTDGTTIRDGCFSDQNGIQVPLMWMHNHDDINQCIGHAVLEARPEGTYAWGKFNDSPAGEQAKRMIKNGDVNSLSIWANKLKRNAGDIYHGVIKEVSLVIGGADPEARIDSIAHGDMSDSECEIWGFGKPELVHTDVDNEEEKMNKDDEKTQSSSDNSTKTVKDVLETLTEEQKKAVSILVSQVVQDSKDTEKKTDDEVKHSDEGLDPENSENDATTNDDDVNVEGEDEMKHNAFEGTAKENYISHADELQIFKDARKNGSLRDTVYDSRENGVLAHSDVDYGIMAGHTSYENGGGVEYLFPDAQTINTTPEFIKRNTDWVDSVLASTHHTPFSRVKSIFADITEDEARARGYIKGKYKKEEVFTLLKRTTDPQIIYKKQKMDKQDIDDITSFTVVAWIKQEMQMMLREELARAILIGDGRLGSSEDKIQEQYIRPVYNDADLFTIKYAVEIPANATPEVKAKALMKAVIKSRKLYKGSGNPSFYTTEDEVTEMLLLENGIGERIYKTEDEVRTALRAKAVTTVEPMEGQEIEIDEGVSGKKKYPVAGISVNLADYNVGTNGGAKTDFFDDFDIDYNQYKYLYETRCSGALIKPFAAITYYYKEVAA